MHAAYPTYQGIGDAINGRGGVAVPGNPQAHYRISLQAGKVAELSLDANDQDCYE
jgi:hypothetical protein